MNVSYLAGKLQDVMYSEPYAQTDSSNNRTCYEQNRVDNKATVFFNASKYRELMK